MFSSKSSELKYVQPHIKMLRAHGIDKSISKTSPGVNYQRVNTLAGTTVAYGGKCSNNSFKVRLHGQFLNNFARHQVAVWINLEQLVDQQLQ